MEQRDTRIIVETARHRITGFLHLPREGYRSRLTDYLNADRAFVALTDAEVAPIDGTGSAERHPFIALAVAHIVLAMPAEGDGPTALTA